MKTRVFISLSILLFLTTSTQVFVQAQSYSGEWKFDKEKSTAWNNRLFLSKITVLQKSDSLFTNRVYENEYGEQYPFKEDLPLNGKECEIVIYDMPRKAKASLAAGDGSLNFESTTTFYGNNGADDVKTTEHWRTENSGKTLKIDYSTSYSGGTSSGTHYFNKVK
jgi:hypothetical protein